MARTLGVVVCTFLLASLVTAAEPPTADVKAQVQTLRKEINDLMQKRDELRRSTEQSDALATLRKVRDETAAEYKKLEKEDTALAETAKAAQEAQSAYEKLIAQKTAEGPEGVALAKEAAQLEAQRHDLQLQDEILQIRLRSPHSPIQRAIEQDPQLAELRKAYQSMDPSKKEERAAAHAKYDKARDEKLAESADAKALEQERAKIKQSISELDKKTQELHAKSREIRDKLRTGADPDVAAALQKMSAANKAQAAARDGEKLKTARETAYAAQKALRDKATELVDADPKGKELKAALEAKTQQLVQLRK